MNPMLRNPRIARAVALVAPLAVLMLLRALGSIEPSSVPAAPPPAPTINADIEPLDRMPPRLAEAQRWLRDWRPDEHLHSPMYYEPAVPEQPAAPAASAAPRTAPAKPRFELKSVMGAGDRVMASINGKVLRLGDEAAPGWRITLLDARSKRVEITGPAGEVTVIEPQPIAH